MDDLISRQSAIDALKDMYHAAEKWREEASDDVIKARAESCMASLIEMKLKIENLPSAQPNLQPTCNNLATDTISRQAAIDALCDDYCFGHHDCEHYPNCENLRPIRKLPSAQPEIIRCKDCKHYEIWQLKSDYTDDKRYKPSVCVVGRYAVHRSEDWFCADAERRTDAAN